MAIQLSVVLRTNRASQIESTIGVSPSLLIFSGAVAANCAAADPTGLLATIVLPADWASQASGVSSLLGTWSAAASAAGVALSFRIKAAAVCHMQGTVGQGAGDLSLNNTNIASGQTVTVTQFDLTEPNA